MTGKYFGCKTMKNLLRTGWGVLAVVLLIGAQTRVDFNMTISDSRVKSFYLAIEEHFNIPGPQLHQIREHYRFRFGDEELPVVFFIAARARVEPMAIINLRLHGKLWSEIALSFGLRPEVIFIPVNIKRIGAPFGRAYGRYRKFGPGADWRRLGLKDREFIDLVNLRFMVDYHGFPPERVMVMRGSLGNYIFINDEIVRERLKSRGKEEKNLEKSGIEKKPTGKARKK